MCSSDLSPTDHFIFAILNLDCEKGKLWVVLGEGVGNPILVGWSDRQSLEVEAAEAHAVHRTSRSFC